jgi:2-phospho-L-lactate guanylyltransferase
MKPLDRAKTRLRGITTPRTHAELVRAFVLDTVAAAIATPGVGTVLVVTSDHTVSAATADIGARTVADQPDGTVRGDGLNAALRYGAGLLRQDHPADQIAALQGDLPALRPVDLAEALAQARYRMFCADHRGSGTTLLVSAPGAPLDPLFGPRSAAAHLASGATALRGALDSLRCDVDTPDDLARAVTLGVGGHTARWLGAKPER